MIHVKWYHILWNAQSFPVPFEEVLVMEQYEQLKLLVEQAAEDVAKAEGGNKAAGTRVRKSMQDIKKAAQDVRTKVLESRAATP